MAVLLHASTDIAPRFMQIAHFSVVSWSLVVALTWLSALILYFGNKNKPPVVMD